MMRINILILSHGSRFDNASVEAEKIAENLQNVNKYGRILTGFAGFNEPDIFAALDELAADTPDHIVIVPLILFEGKHAVSDVSQALRYRQSKYPKINFIATDIIGADTALLPAVYDNINSTLSSLKARDNEAVILMVYRGSTAVSVFEDSRRITAAVRAKYPYTYGSYIEMNSPDMLDGLAMAQDAAVKYGKKHIIIVPYLLFGGVLLDKIHKIPDISYNKGIGPVVAKHLAASSSFFHIILNTINETVKKKIYKEVD